MNIKSWRMVSAVGEKCCNLGIYCEQKDRGKGGMHVLGTLNNELWLEIKALCVCYCHRNTQIDQRNNSSEADSGMYGLLYGLGGSISNQWGKEAVGQLAKGLSS